MSAELQADLDAFVVGDAEWIESDDDVPPPEDPAGADRLLRAVRAYERKIVEVLATANANIEQIATWRDERERMAIGQIERLTRSLETWMRHRHVTSGGKVKTEKLPSGELSVRALSRSLLVDDDVAAIEWAVVNRAEWLRIKVEIDRALARDELVIGDVAVEGPHPPDEGYEWRRAFTEDGEQIPGLLVQEPATLKSKRYRPKFGFKTTKQEATP